MKRYLAIFLTTISFNALADWVQLTQTQTNSFYYDPTTIKKVGNLIRVWELIDNVTPNKIGSLSSRMLTEMDCSGNQSRTIEYTYHTGHMATGEINYMNSTISQWFQAPPNTVQQQQLKFYCAQ